MLSPLWREIAADLDTPVSAYLKLARGRYGFLLECVEGGERLARYSFVGTDPYMVLRVRDGVAEWRWLSWPASWHDRDAPHAPIRWEPFRPNWSGVRVRRLPGAAAFLWRRGRLSELRGRRPLRANGRHPDATRWLPDASSCSAIRC